MALFDFFKKDKGKKKEEAKKPEAKADSCNCGSAHGGAKPAAAGAKGCPTKTAESIAASRTPMADLGGLLPGAPPGGKVNLAIYWAAACGGCDVSILDVNERILTIGDMANIVMWPIAADGKEHDIEEMDDGSILVTLVSGAVRNSENEHMVKLLRKKSAIVIAYGACACFGGSPALANLCPGSKDILDYVYTKTPTTANFQKDYAKGNPIMPQQKCTVPEGDLTLPQVYDTVKTLDQVIDVDYYVPGCPPAQETISHLLKALVETVYNGAALPPKGATIGVTAKTLCDQCNRRKEFRRITKIYEPHEVDVDPELCLMDQGILCLGPATVGGCNALCTSVGQPCRGCYGPTTAVMDQGASAMTAIASLFPVLDEDATCEEDLIIDIMSSVKDPLGYFYAFSMGKALIKRSVSEKGGK